MKVYTLHGNIQNYLKKYFVIFFFKLKFLPEKG